MIESDARLSVRIIPIEQIQVKECQARYPKRLKHYMRLLKLHPKAYAGFLSVIPSDTHSGMFALLDGHTRFCASIMVGRCDVLCVVKEEKA